LANARSGVAHGASGSVIVGALKEKMGTLATPWYGFYCQFCARASAAAGKDKQRADTTGPGMRSTGRGNSRILLAKGRAFFAKRRSIAALQKVAVPHPTKSSTCATEAGSPSRLRLLPHPQSRFMSHRSFGKTFFLTCCARRS